MLVKKNTLTGRASRHRVHRAIDEVLLVAGGGSYARRLSVELGLRLDRDAASDAAAQAAELELEALQVAEFAHAECAQVLPLERRERRHAAHALLAERALVRAEAALAEPPLQRTRFRPVLCTSDIRTSHY